VQAILRVERPAPGHLFWPELDVDIAVDSTAIALLPPCPRSCPHSRRSRPKGPLRELTGTAANQPRLDFRLLMERWRRIVARAGGCAGFRRRVGIGATLPG
jgi:hypothetical protein